MSCYYKALPKLIPEIILTAGIESEIAVVSPWIWNVDLYPPKFGNGIIEYKQRKIKIQTFFIRLLKEFNYRFIFVTRPDDQKTNAVMQPVYKVKPKQVIVLELEYVHAKMIVTPNFAIEMTANLITTSLNRNIETCSIVNNRFKNSRKYIEEKTGIII